MKRKNHQRYGESAHILTRPKLHAIIRKLVPEEKILFGKKVLDIQQDANGVRVSCGDNSDYSGDVLIGADGAYSSVRQAMYKKLHDEGRVPADDMSDPPFNTLCLVGVTEPLPAGSFEYIEGESRSEAMVYSGHPYVSMFFSNFDGSVSWMVLQHAGSFTTRSEERLRNSEWEPNDCEPMIEQVRDLPSPFGNTLGVYIDKTPREGISRVMLEEKLYRTWHHGRIALLGDACHKLFPSAGQGAMCAMLDAVVLANVLQACPTTSVEDIERCLGEYRDERFPHGEIAYNTSHRVGEFFKKTFWSDILRFIIGFLPRSILTHQLDKLSQFRPQASFLPFVPPTGIAMPLPQKTYDHLKTSVLAEL
ncbi:hypothetical protein DFQ27_002497 [Actinomortierella ambigua]|uniref:FAD-binding domain-containing protein n=1 Tax=Actinomortierella ambigua TaxID=1343610 RepID=A0A9P6QAR5_9FUNG|nr:hypothetical protein DFQ27_002497 [Actinomortierella ambigua]